MDQQTAQFNILNKDNLTGSESPVVIGYDLTRYQYFLASPFYAGFDNFQDTKRKLFLEEFKNMPSSIKNFLTSIETAKTIFAAGQENQLFEDQIYQTAELFRDVVSGKVFVKDIPLALSQKINIEETKASVIINKIVSNSFPTIIEDIKRVQRSKFPDRVAQLQKEAQPEQKTFSQPTAKPVAPRQAPTPAQQLAEKQSTQPPVQVQEAPQSQPAPKQPEIQPPPVSTPPPVMPPQQPKEQTIPQKSESKPQFRIPDLGQEVSKENGGKAQTAQKSLEEELQKVASIIDLRDKQNS